MGKKRKKAELCIGNYLEKHNISKNAFARTLGLKPQAVRPYFYKDYDPKFSTLSKWAVALDCKISDLYKEAK